MYTYIYIYVLCLYISIHTQLFSSASGYAYREEATISAGSCTSPAACARKAKAGWPGGSLKTTPSNNSGQNALTIFTRNNTSAKRTKYGYQ